MWAAKKTKDPKSGHNVRQILSYWEQMPFLSVLLRKNAKVKNIVKIFTRFGTI